MIIMSLSLAFYVGLTSAFWDFSTLRGFNGMPLAADFSNYWAASKLALSGKSALIYNVNDLHDIQQQALGITHRYGVGWYYPPTFLLFVQPLGRMPYLLALFVWLAVTLILFMAVLSRISTHHIILPLCLIFPGTYVNFIFGQNAFLSGILLGGGLLLLDHFPIVAGLCFGLLTYKPPLVVLVLFALIIGRYWKSLIGAFISSLIVTLASIIMFGSSLWVEYFKVMSIPMHQLEMGQAPWNIMPTFFSAVLSAGFGVRAAYLVQGAVMAAVLVGVAWVWRRKTSIAIRGSVLVLGTLLFTPYAFIYELALLALPLSWLWEEGHLHGRLPGELFILLLGWFLPLAVPCVWDIVNFHQGKLQIGPEILSVLFLLALIKAKIAIKVETQQ